MILDLLFLIIEFVGPIVFHELGHIALMQHHLKRKINLYFSKGSFQVGTQEERDELTEEQHKQILIAGVLAGLIFIFAFANYLNTYLLLVILTCYTVGSLSDIKQILRYQYGRER